MHPDAYREMAQTEASHWWYAGRRKVLSAAIARLHLPARARILEIGCGTGGNLAMLATFGSVSAMESDDRARALALDGSGGRFDIRPGSCPDRIPFPAQAYDLVCLFDVLEHIEDDLAALQAVARLLAHDGVALVTVPAYRWLWSQHDEFLHHKRRYVAGELRRKAADAGLRPATLSYFNTLLFPLAAAARLLSRTASGRSLPPRPVNALLRAVFSCERFLVGRLPLPFGVSLLGAFRAGGA